MLLPDHEIRALCVNLPAGQLPMIEPFAESVSVDGRVSSGLTSAGYDLRMARKVLIFKDTSGVVLMAKRFKDPAYLREVFDEVPVRVDDDDGREYVVLPPRSYILAESMEYLRIPRHLKGRCTGKSTLARMGIIVNITPEEPEWEGILTIEISNVSPCPAGLFIGDGCAQLEIELLHSEPEVSYKDKRGIYQGQTGVTPARTRTTQPLFKEKT